MSTSSKYRDATLGSNTAIRSKSCAWSCPDKGAVSTALPVSPWRRKDLGASLSTLSVRPLDGRRDRQAFFSTLTDPFLFRCFHLNDQKVQRNKAIEWSSDPAFSDSVLEPNGYALGVLRLR